ncbi:Amino acid/amide ABC transporter membrane protein 1, HAAT family [Bosea sp. 62]|uniref:branched-chain amino acid ABC transporter permease n=1 Tax=unclassified Bosea (in: a-proteobacteria) TaxID=2653178 RepID=UPI00125593C9|nr:MULTISPECIES: branched-chain amino acid ABC transporter permease [unclassified Bosea (in: a-proteobacteria)]CAD5253158.1 Amino acid/amide ABC transporter membrane protein 1, HAAT family [Bosea sp. 7B]CAD5278161.1 Amino acid/amide ABC transporter membrane protein 1, HAAT family [Bosea sp. 21B]CAD5279207.1 Amino acid/amide ABC transporter membrane protein 1, HAAT family [Bosea sp. 46]VVT59687.1 Amino acid/amide ABC transporter membrane protein 1, HAAT family [Bosea sp. EC-HK365B]VXB39349.1 Am
MLDMILSQAVNGLVLGFLYVLIAVGLSIIFGLLGIVNFAHGAFFALGAYVALVLAREFGWWAALLAPFVTGALGMLVEIVLIRHLYGKEPLLGLILTFALALLFEAVLRLIFGGAPLPFSAPRFLSGFVEYGPVLLTKYRMFVLLVTVAALVAFWAFLTYTPFGRIIRAGSRDAEMVGLLGINLPVVFSFVFGIGCLLAGLAGLLAAPLWTVTPTMAASAIMPAFVIVTIGGLGSYAGAIVAGLLVGITIAMTIQFQPEWAGAAMYVLMAAILLVRPRGLFGEKWERFE